MGELVLGELVVSVLVAVSVLEPVVAMLAAVVVVLCTKVEVLDFVVAVLDSVVPVLCAVETVLGAEVAVLDFVTLVLDAVVIFEVAVVIGLVVVVLRCASQSASSWLKRPMVCSSRWIVLFSDATPMMNPNSVTPRTAVTTNSTRSMPVLDRQKLIILPDLLPERRPLSSLISIDIIGLLDGRKSSLAEGAGVPYGPLRRTKWNRRAGDEGAARE